jgi:hypothetical protein
MTFALALPNDAKPLPVVWQIVLKYMFARVGGEAVPVGGAPNFLLLLIGDDLGTTSRCSHERFLLPQGFPRLFFSPFQVGSVTSYSLRWSWRDQNFWSSAARA